MLQQPHPKGGQAFKPADILLARWPETDLVIVDAKGPLLPLRRHGDSIGYDQRPTLNAGMYLQFQCACLLRALYGPEVHNDDYTRINPLSPVDVYRRHLDPMHL